MSLLTNVSDPVGLTNSPILCGSILAFWCAEKNTNTPDATLASYAFPNAIDNPLLALRGIRR